MNSSGEAVGDSGSAVRTMSQTAVHSRVLTPEHQHEAPPPGGQEQRSEQCRGEHGTGKAETGDRLDTRYTGTPCATAAAPRRYTVKSTGSPLGSTCPASTPSKIINDEDRQGQRGPPWPTSPWRAVADSGGR